MKQRIVVTGAAGFLGGRTAKYLASNFDIFEIIATSRRGHRSKELAAEGCLFIQGDLCDPDHCERITKSVDAVVHCAAMSAPFGRYEDFYQANYVATKNLIESSLKNGVKKFIFISTPSIYFDYSDRYNVKESDELPIKMVNHYAQTKLMAESLVLEKSCQNFKTMALRPRAIIGAEDTVIFPRMLEAYHQGKLKIVGDGQNICDFTCVRNVIESIICCLHAQDDAYGEAYNITDGKAIKFWDALSYALTELGLKHPRQKVPKKVAMFAASILEIKTRLFQPTQEPSLTRYGVGILANSFTLDIAKAKDKLNYKPVMQTLQGIDEYIQWHKTNY